MRSDGDPQTRSSERSPPALASLLQNGDDLVQDCTTSPGEDHGASWHDEAHEHADKVPAKQEVAPLPCRNTQQPTPENGLSESRVSPSDSE